MRRLHVIASLIWFVSAGSTIAADPWKPAQGPLATRWAKQVSPDNALPEYPRPQLVRGQWQNLNGLWKYAIRPKDSVVPDKFDGEILVPFPVESALSGVMKKVGPDKRLWYERSIPRPEIAEGRRLLLHFGAVDWHAIVWVNGNKVGEHKGGYVPFTCDITEAIGTTKSTRDVIVVSVWDPTDAGFQPRGKQVREPRGIWYTSVTGIWQTVWLEEVPDVRIESLKITPDVDRSEVTIEPLVLTKKGRGELHVTVRDGDAMISEASHPVLSLQDGIRLQHKITLPVKDAKRWSPSSPFLYDVQVKLTWKDQPTDAVTSYFGMRKIDFRKDEDGLNRLFLNNQPLFQFGPLDQGWWPDGLYTAPTDEALRYDIEVTKKLGMNMCRKHVKVEPARWYYWCDKLGLLVWQDMPNGDRHIGPKAKDLDCSAESADNFRREYQALIDTFYNHPCIVAWVPFNEGWGQFETSKVLAWTKQYDPTRLVDGPSGWTDRGTGDMHDIHRYPGPAMPQTEEKRAVVLGEFGGLGWPVEGHLWWNKRNWGYRTYKSQAELQQNYDMLIKKLRPMIGRGLAAAIYTQTTDVEGEVNGLMTYDRAMVKLDAEKVAKAHAALYRPQPIMIVSTIVPTAEKGPQAWRYTTDAPGAEWYQADFDDISWKEGSSGFGEKTTPGAIVRTEWKTKNIWTRRDFELKEGDYKDLQLRIHHDEDAEVFINGKLAAKVTGFVTEYVEVEISDAARGALCAGKNTLAVHCSQTAGGQYIDVGLVDVVEKKRGK